MKEFLKKFLADLFKTGGTSKPFSFDWNDFKTTAKRTAIGTAGAAGLAGLAYLNGIDYGFFEAASTVLLTGAMAVVAAWVKGHTK